MNRDSSEAGASFFAPDGGPASQCGGDARDLRVTARELVAYNRSILIRSAATFGAMLVTYAGYLPVWGLVLANLVLYPEIYLRMHDIGHGSTIGAFGWAARFVPVTNPIWGGTRVFATIHREHHKYLGTDQDPWLPYYMGHPLRALFFNLIEPEYSLREFVRRQGIDRELAANIAYNVTCLVAGLVVFRWAYVAHLISQRLTHMTGIFFFNFYTHRATLSADAPVGTWERERELRRALPLLRLVWGRDTIDGLIYHNRHHCMGQQHIPVRSYKSLVDSGAYSRFHDAWPISTIKRVPPS